MIAAQIAREVLQTYAILLYSVLFGIPKTQWGLAWDASLRQDPKGLQAPANPSEVNTLMMPTKFWVPWSEIDPEMRHGGIPGELAEFVAPDINDNKTTQNVDQVRIFAVVRDACQSISMSPESMKEGEPRRRIVEECLRAINDILEKALDRSHSSATRTFEWCHAVPPQVTFPLSPIRFPLRNPFANEFVHYMLGTMVEIAELNCNANHAGLGINDVSKIVAPCYQWKANVIKHYFDHEVAGEISSAELDQLFQGIVRPGPVVSPPDASAQRPSDAGVAEALSGIDVIQWFPNDSDWAIFGNLERNRYVPERIYQPEGAYPSTEDVQYEHRTGPGGQPLTGPVTSGPGQP